MARKERKLRAGSIKSVDVVFVTEIPVASLDVRILITKTKYELIIKLII